MSYPSKYNLTNFTLNYKYHKTQTTGNRAHYLQHLTDIQQWDQPAPSSTYSSSSSYLYKYIILPVIWLHITLHWLTRSNVPTNTVMMPHEIHNWVKGVTKFNITASLLFLFSFCKHYYYFNVLIATTPAPEYCRFSAGYLIVWWQCSPLNLFYRRKLWPVT